jgi:sulfate adenylyltransferase
MERQQYGSIPHGGELINRRVAGDEAQKLANEAAGLFARELSPRELSDVLMITIGGYSPLTGFMTEADYIGVVNDMRLAGGLPWTIPVTLSLSREQAGKVQQDDRIALTYDGKPLAIMEVTDKFTRDKQHEARQVYRTDEEKHPGVAALYREGDVVIGGPISTFGELPEPQFPEFQLTPAQTRQAFADKGWKTVVGFQTRNPVHRAHEYIQKCAMEIVDGLLLHPLVGETKSDDIPADIRMKAYQVLLANYYPESHAMLSVNPAAMRYAGPREAIFHALIRKNFGCTHFIVGRDHAGVPGYYGPYDAHYIFDEFAPGEIGIQPLFFENSFFCNRCGNMATDKTCPHPAEDHVVLSGTKVREMLRSGQAPPPTFSRPEVVEVLIEGMKARD